MGLHKQERAMGRRCSWIQAWKLCCALSSDTAATWLPPISVRHLAKPQSSEPSLAPESGPNASYDRPLCREAGRLRPSLQALCPALLGECSCTVMQATLGL